MSPSLMIKHAYIYTYTKIKTRFLFGVFRFTDTSNKTAFLLGLFFPTLFLKHREVNT